jgi:hypothetical protein
MTLISSPYFLNCSASLKIAPSVNGCEVFITRRGEYLLKVPPPEVPLNERAITRSKWVLIA